MGGKIYSSDVFGNTIEIQCKITRGLPSVQIVGLANKALEESKERIRAAFHSNKLEFPKARVLVNLSPAELPKDGSSFDLPIAIAILQAAEIIRPLKGNVFASGELSLDGRIGPVRGIIGRLRATGVDFNAYILPADNSVQASLLLKKGVVHIQTLSELIEILSGVRKPTPAPVIQKDKIQVQDNSFSEVRGQALAKRALEIAAAGRHNVLLYGPPGTGKSMLAKALTSILPDLTDDEIIETTHISSLRDNQYDLLISRPPMRAPHHSASNISILGGGQKARPGEISLAHNGVLFLDEMLEFSRSCIEALRQPLEDKIIHISRADQSCTYPASFLLVATMNPCPCGNLGSTKECTCMPHIISQYQKKLSGPIADRIDLFVKVEEVPIDQLLTEPTDDSTQDVKSRVAKAQHAQRSRNARKHLNSSLTNPAVRKLGISDEARSLLDTAAERLRLSPRAYFRVLRVAQTISDLEGKPNIDSQSIAESLQFRESLPTASF